MVCLLYSPAGITQESPAHIKIIEKIMVYVCGIFLNILILFIPYQRLSAKVEINLNNVECISIEKLNEFVFLRPIFTTFVSDFSFKHKHNMDKIKVAVVGYGNIGKYVVEALQVAPDFELVGIVRRNPNHIPEELHNYTIVSHISQLSDVEVALLCVPTRNVEQYASEALRLGIHTVDSFDIHTQIVPLHQTLDRIARENQAVSIMSAGWDPGSDSVVRTLLEACAPKGITYTNFGPGMSMGHTVAVKAIEGVKSALSMTIPTGTSIHRRMVYVELEAGYSLAEIAQKVKNDPYFIHDETHVMQVESVNSLLDMGHGVNLIRKGVSGKTQNQLFEFNMRINNPALTAQIMVSAARATLRQQPGCYSLIEIPLIDMLYGERNELIQRLV